MRRLTGHRRHDERGAVVVLVAVFLTTILAMAALVVDVGSILDEKRQLQNGADAAALGAAQLVGQACPRGPCSPPTVLTLQSAADSLARANAGDDAASVEPVSLDFVNQRVTVKTSTKTANGGTILPYWFGTAVTGSPGKQVKATAVASWAGLKKAKAIPLTISRCDFDAATSLNTAFNVSTQVFFHGNVNDCHSRGSSGADFPGGFGWVIDDLVSDCDITLTVNDTVIGDTGSPGTPHSCVMSTMLGQDILVPIYDGLVKNKKWEYHIYGFGQFHLTGFQFPTQQSVGVTCSKCIVGYFIRFVGIGDYGGPNLGNQVALVS
jgi:hypothetical protein